MNVQFHIRGLNVDAGACQSFEQSLGALQRQISITAAAVVLEHRRDDAPAFRAYVSLAVPGPDIHAEAIDHTLVAAWRKVSRNLEKQIEQRKAKEAGRLKVNRQQILSTPRWSKPAAVSR
jgi:ribosome-associated translation inhibitor RaiA